MNNGNTSEDLNEKKKKKKNIEITLINFPRSYATRKSHVPYPCRSNSVLYLPEILFPLQPAGFSSFKTRPQTMSSRLFYLSGISPSIFHTPASTTATLGLCSTQREDTKTFSTLCDPREYARAWKRYIRRGDRSHLLSSQEKRQVSLTRLVTSYSFPCAIPIAVLYSHE